MLGNVVPARQRALIDREEEKERVSERASEKGIKEFEKARGWANTCNTVFMASRARAWP